MIRAELLKRLREMFYESGGVVFTDGGEAKLNGFDVLQRATHRDYIRDMLGPQLGEEYGVGNWGISPTNVSGVHSKTMNLDVWVKTREVAAEQIRVGRPALRSIMSRAAHDLDKL